MTYEIHPFKDASGMWSFHTPRLRYPQLPERELEDNALVAGIDTLLDQIAAAHGAFVVRFADEVLPLDSELCAELELSWTEGDRHNPAAGGNWYLDESGLKGWLCPVLFDYYPVVPMKLYLQILPLARV